MQDILNTVHYLSSGIAAMVCTVSLIFGLLEGFFGYKIMKLMFAVTGFIGGGLLGMALYIYLIGSTPQDVGPAVLCGILAGVAVAYLLYKVYLIGVFFSNAALMFLLGILLCGTEQSDLILSAACGVVVGVLAVKFVRIWVIAVSGVSGGMAAGPALMGLLGQYQAGPAMLAGVVLAILGILYQWKTTDGEFVKTKKAAAPAAPVPPVTPAAPAAPAVKAAKAPKAPAPAPFRHTGPLVTPIAAPGGTAESN